LRGFKDLKSIQEWLNISIKIEGEEKK